MREIRSSGSVRGVRSDPYPYHDATTADAVGSAILRDAGAGLAFRCPLSVTEDGLYSLS